MFVYIAYNLVMLLFFFFISLPFMVNKRYSNPPSVTEQDRLSPIEPVPLIFSTNTMTR